MLKMKSRAVARLVTMALFLPCLRGLGQTNPIIYDNALENGWINYSWATVSLANSSPVHSGSDSISVSCNNYEALYLHHAPFDSSGYTNLSFWINGGSAGGQSLHIAATLSGAAQTSVSLTPPLANTWTYVTVSLASLGVANKSDFDGFWIQSNSGNLIPTFYVDDIMLLGAPLPPAPNPTNFIGVDVALNRHAISPYIYGVAFADSNQMADLNCTVNRSGGNAETTYNWQINAHNHASDWFFESIPDSPATPAASSDEHVANSIAGGGKAMLTIPMIGWVPKLGSSRSYLWSYSVQKYGPQKSTDNYYPDAGDGLTTNGVAITNNNPNDAYFATNSTFQLAFLQHLTNTWGLGSNGGVAFYCMDNEHSLWQSTHQDIHPVGPTMQEIRGKFLDYASVVKSVDPSALIVFPEEWGWNGYFYSGYDQQVAPSYNYNVAAYPDRLANGGWDYMPWLLNQIHQHDTNSHQRLLDYFTLHWYPQGGESSADISSSTQLLRNRSTRSLWDNNYIDQSWINSVVQLIPRMKSWVSAYYPGTKIGITEYNWGADDYINGATAQADVLGIFGRESLDLATRWTVPNTGTPAYNAFKMYRNYDGNKSTFGDTSVLAGVTDPDNVAAFAAQNSTNGLLTVMIVSKYLTGVAPLQLALTNFTGSGTAKIWQLNSSNSIARLADLPYSGGKLSLTVPGQSITLLVISTKNPTVQAGPVRADGKFAMSISGDVGSTFVVQASSDLLNWIPVSTNVLASSPMQLTFPTSLGRQFYRVVP